MPHAEAWALRQKITGVLVRQVRQEAGKSLEQCANVLGLSSSEMSEIEFGERAISLPELELLSFYFGVPLERLLDDNGPAENDGALGDATAQALLALRHRIIGVLLRKARLAQELAPGELGKHIDVSKSTILKYELGQTAIPLVHLEMLADALRVPLDYFLDDGIGPVGKHQRYERESRQFAELPAEVRKFILEPSHLAYLQLAMSLSGMPAEKLRNIAASLLDITL
jgi:transcriptional regulator with XRE-family HTH domain